MHIPKTGGGTVKDMLSRGYSRAAVHDAGNYLRSPETAARKVSRRPGGWERWHRAGGQVAIGHVPYALFREHLPRDTRYVTFLREPVDRVLSHYHRHLRETGTWRDERRRDRGMPVAGSIEEALDGARLHLANLATRLLCEDSSPTEELPATALEEAKANLRRFAMVGIQERFDESVVLLQRALGLDLVSYVNRHVSADRPHLDEISDEDRALIAEHNRLDAALYRYGLELFEENAAAADDGFADDVEELRRRSAATNREAIERARAFVDRELPPGAERTKTELFAAARAQGVPTAALKHVSTTLQVSKAGVGEEIVWSRPC